MRPRNYRANSPGRKSARRIAALARMKATPEKPTRTQAAHDAEYLALSSRIVPQAQADAVRTKKSGTSAVRRAAWARRPSGIAAA